MFDRKVIDKNIQETLFKKINASKRNEFSSDINAKKFFQDKSLDAGIDAGSTNPFSEHLIKNCFAKVSVAYPQEDENSNIVRRPYSLSSYLNQDNFDQSGEDTTGIQNQYAKSISNKNVPLTFQEGYFPGYEEDSKGLRGHSGITKISVAQQEYYTYKFTIDWVCPDPIYFDEKFEPRFLQMGAYCAIEFGWGIEDKDFNVPALTIEEMNNLLESNKLRERNLKSRGNYYCGVGVVTKFDWKIASDGSYTGTLEVITPGASNLLQTNQDAKNSGGTITSQKITNTLELIQITKELIESEEIKLDGKERQEFLESFNNAQQISQKLKENSLTFSIVMRNFNKVVDKWIDKYGGTDNKNTDKKDISDKADDRYLLDFPENPEFDFKSKEASLVQLGKESIGTALEYKYYKGALNIKIKEPKTTVRKPDASELAETTGLKYTHSWPVQDHLKDRYFINWGWFEDNILNAFYSMTSNKQIIQEVKSSTSDKDNQCNSSPYLYSMGLDSVILPKKMHPILENGFKSFIGKTKKAPYSRVDSDGNPIDSSEIITDSSIEDRNFIAKYYSREQRIRMNRIYKIFKKIDDFFPGFESQPAVMQEDDENTPDDESRLVKTPGKGTIRNMVFPTEMFVKHFSNSPSLRQGLRNFWADVNNQYGRYWKFDIGEDRKPGRVGVFDKNFNVDKSISFQTPISTEKDPTKMFVFEILSNNSIVKTFDVQLKMSGEAAVLARYGTFTKAGSGTVKADGKKDLGLEAWNIINSRNELKSEILKKELIDRYNKTNDMGTLDNLEITNDLKDFYETISEIQEGLEENKDLVSSEIKSYINGVGLYNSRGELSPYFRQTMLYLINYARMKDSKSLIEVSQPILPVELSMTLDGIGGLEVGNCFKVDYLPQIYRDFCYFMINKVDHSISKSGWETSIGAVMIADLPSFWQESGKKLGEGLENYIELFEITDKTILDINDRKQLDLLFTEQNNTLIDKFTRKYNNTVSSINLSFSRAKKYSSEEYGGNFNAQIDSGLYNAARRIDNDLQVTFRRLIDSYRVRNDINTMIILYEKHCKLLKEFYDEFVEYTSKGLLLDRPNKNTSEEQTYELVYQNLSTSISECDKELKNLKPLPKPSRPNVPLRSEAVEILGDLSIPLDEPSRPNVPLRSESEDLAEDLPLEEVTDIETINMKLSNPNNNNNDRNEILDQAEKINNKPLVSAFTIPNPETTLITSNTSTELDTIPTTIQEVRAKYGNNLGFRITDDRYFINNKSVSKEEFDIVDTIWFSNVTGF